MALKFDKIGLQNEIFNELQKELSYALLAWENEVLSKSKHGLYGKKMHPEVSTMMKRGVNKITAYLEANTYVLAESYGTGSFMLDDNPGLVEYRTDPQRWNPARKGKTIVGRPKGSYTNLFNQERTTSGQFEGVNIEGRKVYSRKKETERDYFISPTKPSYAIQLAENWLWKTYLPRAYKNAIQRVNFSKYLK